MLLAQDDIESTRPRTDTHAEKIHAQHKQIMEATKPRNIVDMLETDKFNEIEEQLTALCDLAKDDDQTIDLRSLQNFTLFVTREQISALEIGINPDGFMQSIWKIHDYGSLAMDFLPSGDVVFSILLYRHEPGLQQQRVSGRVSHHHIMQYIREFATMHDRGPEHQVNIHTKECPAWCAQIINAKTTATIIDILGSNNFADIAKRLADLNVMAKENGETIVLQSLQKFAIFVACEKLPTFNIGINPDGFIQLLCRAPDHGSLAMDFLPSGDVVFSILFYLHEPGSRQQKVSGRVSLHRVMHYIIEFIDRTATQQMLCIDPILNGKLRRICCSRMVYAQPPMTSEIDEDCNIDRHCSSMFIRDDGFPKIAVFQLRQGKDFLSVNWIEYFGMSNRNDNMLEVQKEVIKHRIIKNGKYAILNIGSVKKTIKEDLGISLEVKLHNDYPSHAGIHGYTVDDHLIAHKLLDTVKPDDMYDILVCSN